MAIWRNLFSSGPDDSSKTDNDETKTQATASPTPVASAVTAVPKPPAPSVDAPSGPVMPQPSPTHDSDRAVDIGKQQVAAVYAKALLAAAVPGKRADTVAELGNVIREGLDRFPRLEAVLSSPRIKADEKQGMLERIFGGRVSPDLNKFLKVVASHERLDCLREIHDAATRQQNQSSGVVQIQVTTAEVLDSQLRNQIETALKAKTGKPVAIRWKVDAALIGGIVVRIGDRVLDASIARRLISVRQEAVNKAVQQMRATSDRFTAT